MTADTFRHGLNGYRNGRCRCQVCRDASATYQRHRRTRLRERPVPPYVIHGTLNAYNNYDCRCGDCRAINAQHSQTVRDRRKAAAS